MWVIFAVLTSIINSFYDMGKQTIKLTPTIFILFRGYITAFIALPFLFLYPYPTQWQFYALCILQGAIVAYNDLINYKATKKYGAEMVSAIQPLSTAFLFFVWFFVAPSILQEYWANKTTFFMIILSLFGITFSIYKYNQQKTCKEALRYMFPIICTSVLINIVNKLTTRYGTINPIATGIYYSFIMSLVVGVVNTFALKGNIQNIKLAYKQFNWKIFIMFALMLLSMICKNASMGLSINPTYVSAIIYLTVLWNIIGNHITAKYKIGKKYPHTKWRYVALLVISSISLIILTN